MNATLTDGDAILRAVLNEPEDDLPRLAYADWLEESGDGDRAEFVRVQLRLAARPPCDCDTSEERVYHDECRCKEKAELRRRERDLFTPQRFWDWFGPCFLTAWPGSPAAAVEGCVVRVGYFSPGSNRPEWRLTFRRGFVEAISLPCRDFLAHAGAISRVQPVTAVKLPDREPSQFPGFTGGAASADFWAWYCMDSDNAPHPDAPPAVLPGRLWRLATAAAPLHHGGYPVFRDPGGAQDALSAACVRFGRAEARKRRR